jgi:hypothetical protein
VEKWPFILLLPASFAEVTGFLSVVGFGCRRVVATAQAMKGDKA